MPYVKSTSLAPSQHNIGPHGACNTPFAPFEAVTAPPTLREVGKQQDAKAVDFSHCKRYTRFLFLNA